MAPNTSKVMFVIIARIESNASPMPSIAIPFVIKKMKAPFKVIAKCTALYLSAIRLERLAARSCDLTTEWLVGAASLDADYLQMSACSHAENTSFHGCGLLRSGQL